MRAKLDTRLDAFHAQFGDRDWILGVEP
jgi:hypothetical protein